ncbi:MAG TPA: ABC transporter substrate-binding protein [Burkholderiales bacterium]|nr:ABC transporter substrate-binding protein [Burkholderiales bacterium]
MDRRDFILFGGVLLASASVHAQSAKPKRVAVLFAGTPEVDERAAAPFFEQLRRLGWIESTNISYEHFYARGVRNKMPELATAAVARHPDLIYAPTAFAAVSATKATSTIPVVFSTVSDPTRIGLADSLARPGRNATGTFQIQADLVAKKFEIMREALPQAKRIAVVLERTGSDYAEQKKRHVDAGRRFALDVSIADFTSFDELTKLLAGLKNERVDAVTVGSSFTLIGNRKPFAQLALQAGIPLVAHRIEWAEAGALITYGADVSDTLRRTAEIAHRILNGARPAETPIEQASKFELVANLSAAKNLGVVLPRMLVSRADRVIE